MINLRNKFVDFIYIHDTKKKKEKQNLHAMNMSKGKCRMEE